MHILICNDDGVDSPGIMDLAHELAKHWRVTVVAPSEEQSAKSHAITIQNPLRLKLHDLTEENPKIYSLSGTPVDCAKFALSYLLVDDMPDLIISGVNNGFNLGSDALYSGTVSAAMEGLFYNVPSLALSVEKYSAQRGAEILPFVVEFVQKIFVEGKQQGLLNVNFPLTGICDWDHVKVVDQGYQKYVNIIDARQDKRGNDYFWVGGDLLFEKESTETDVWAIKQGFVTVVALTWRQQDHQGTETVKSLLTKA